MVTIELLTEINAPIHRCFDLSTSIDLHKISATGTKEEAISGVTHGLIGLHQTVTWRAKHFGFWHKMKVEITEYQRPNYFVDEMIDGSFKFMKHNHHFQEKDHITLMKDSFQFSSPFGAIGRFTDFLILKKYLSEFLIERNSTIKEFAETEKWKSVL